MQVVIQIHYTDGTKSFTVQESLMPFGRSLGRNNAASHHVVKNKVVCKHILPEIGRLIYMKEMKLMYSLNNKSVLRDSSIHCSLSRGA